MSPEKLSEISPSNSEDQKIESSMEGLRFSSTIKKGSTEGLISSEMLKRLAVDSAYAHKTKSNVSLAAQLVKGKSLRQAMLLKEILNNPYDCLD
jgi:hypothetical protein